MDDCVKVIFLFVRLLSSLVTKEVFIHKQIVNYLKNVENIIYLGQSKIPKLLQVKGILYYMSGKQMQRAKFGATG